MTSNPVTLPDALPVDSPDAGTDERTRLKLASRLVLLVALTLVAYHNSFAGKMAFDDYRYLGEEKFGELESLARNTLRPVLFWSLAANHWVGQTNAFGYHAFNLAVHVAAGLVLFGLTRRTLLSPGCAGRFTPERSLEIAWLVALVWSVHPLTTQAVTYLIQRAESLASLFYLVTLYAVARCAASGARGASWAWGFIAIGACWLGLGSKEIAATIPVSALLYDRVFHAAGWGEVARRRGWIYLGQLSPLIWFGPRLVRYLFFSQKVSMGFGLQAISPWEYAYNQPAVLLHYLRLVFWPHPLCLDYVWRPVSRGTDALLPCLFVAGFLGITAYGIARLRPWGWLSATFFLILAPTSSFIPIADLAFEHRMYLPLAAVVALVVIGVAQWLTARHESAWVRRIPWLAWQAVTGIVVLALMARTVARNADYADPERLWRSVLAVSPHNPRAHSNLGGVLYAKGEHRAAAAAFLQAARLRPDDYNSIFGLALSLDALGRHDDAIRCFRRGIELKPDSSIAHNDMGTSLEKGGKYEEAERAYRRALELDSDFEIAAYNLGSLLLKQSRDREALPYLELALEKNPERAATRRQLAWMLATTEDESLRSLERARSLLDVSLADPRARSPRALDALAAIHAASGQFDLAVATIDEALRMARERQLGELVAELEARRSLYQRHVPFVRNGA